MGRNKHRQKISIRLAQAAIVGLLVCGVTAAAAQAQDGGLWQREKLIGDWGGARTALKARGIDVTLQYIGETLSVLSGGIRRATSYEGRLEFSVDTDLDKLIGWAGASTHVTMFNINNSGSNAADNVGAIADPSNIDALPTTRLFTVWFQQNFHNDMISVRLGQLAADDEFFTSDTAGGLINGTFGWGGNLAANITNGGPAYPLATPGARLQVMPMNQLTVLAAVFSGDPAGRNCLDDAQVCNKHGTTFSFAGGALWMGEAQYAVNTEKNAAGLPGVYKLGVWYATKDFGDVRFGIDGAGMLVSLGVDDTADPVRHRGNWGFYAVADQTIWRGEARSVNVFLRGGFSPSNRNLLSVYVDGGFGIKGPIAGRPDDTLTFGVAYARISSDVTGEDRDALAASGPPFAVRRNETVFELSYLLQVAPWWSIQPDLQYIVRPNGGQNPGDPTLTLGNAFIAGVRSTITF